MKVEPFDVLPEAMEEDDEEISPLIPHLVYENNSMDEEIAVEANVNEAGTYIILFFV